MTVEAPRLHLADINRDLTAYLVGSLQRNQFINPALIEVDRLKYRLPPRNPKVVYSDLGTDFQLDPESRLYAGETKLLNNLIAECDSYMPKDTEGKLADIYKIIPAIS